MVATVISLSPLRRLRSAALTGLLAAAPIAIAGAQDAPVPRASLVFGLNQPLLLGGFNVEGNWWTRRVVVDYSHGINLSVPADQLPDAYRQQGVDVIVRHSLGLGVGYRITPALNLRLEPKLHTYDLAYADRTGGRARVATFTTYTLGVGAYYLWLPFQHRGGRVRGLSVVPSVRFWPRVGSSLAGDRLAYDSRTLGRRETLPVPNIGGYNTPWVINVSVGYTLFR